VLVQCLQKRFNARAVPNAEPAGDVNRAIHRPTKVAVRITLLPAYLPVDSIAHYSYLCVQSLCKYIIIFTLSQIIFKLYFTLSFNSLTPKDMHVGQKLKSAVEQSSMTAREISKQLGISDAHLYNLYKKATIDVKYISKASEIFNLPIDYFIEGSNDGKNIDNKLIASLENRIEELKQQNEFLQRVLSKVLDLQEQGKLNASTTAHLFALAEGRALMKVAA
jgi:transcriptional regulator with XRE-family HTH domain